MYHDVYVNDITESGFKSLTANIYKLDTERFDNQVRLIHNYCRSKKIDTSEVIITIDDGGTSSYSIIPDILEKHGFRGRFFIITSLIGQEGFLTADQIIDLHKRGHKIGTHSHTHPLNMSDLCFEEMSFEWTYSISILENLINEKILEASLPGGHNPEKSGLILAGLGIKYIYTSEPTLKIREVKPGHFELGRFAVMSGMKQNNILSLMSHNKLYLFKLKCRWYLLNIAKIVLGKKYKTVRIKLFTYFNKDKIVKV